MSKDEIISMPKLIGTEQIPYDIVLIGKKKFINEPLVEKRIFEIKKLEEVKKLVCKIMESITCRKN